MQLGVFDVYAASFNLFKLIVKVGCAASDAGELPIYRTGTNEPAGRASDASGTAGEYMRWIGVARVVRGSSKYHRRNQHARHFFLLKFEYRCFLVD